MRKPLTPENQTDKDDLRNVYNPNKHLNHIGNYQKQTVKDENKSIKNLAQINPVHPTGLEPAPKDQ